MPGKKTKRPTRSTRKSHAPTAAVGGSVERAHYSAARFLTLARRILRAPTAPYYESFVQQAICQFVLERGSLEMGFDAHGNLLIRYDGAATGGSKSRRSRKPAAAPAGRWVLTAHLDHPGMAVQKMLPGGKVELEFLGGVGHDYFKGAGIALYSLDRPAGQPPLKARVVEARLGKDERGRERVQTVIARLRRPLPAGVQLDARWFAMWDLPVLERQGDMLSGRVMDDLMGAVCALALLDELHRRRPALRVDVLLTRAEEVGLCGMIAAARGQGLSRAASYINIECSNYAGRAVQGGGPVIRVGDYLSLFDPGITADLVEAARPLVAAGSLKIQRKLMDGGTCEASVLCHEGYRTGAVCLALKNYHNQGDRNKIAPEMVALSDALGLVDLFWQVVHTPVAGNAADAPGRRRMTQMLDLLATHSDARLKRTRPLFR